MRQNDADVSRKGIEKVVIVSEILKTKLSYEFCI